MVDKFTKAKRSEIMTAIHSKNAHSTERRLRAGLASARLSGWRMNTKDLVGKPDFVFDDKKVIVFVDGCFWHGCKCKRLSKTHKGFWKNKLKTNIARDKRVSSIASSRVESN
jgi:DNA mismatch endonuclease (patch repair protein)